MRLKKSQKTQLTHNRALCFGFPSHCSFGRGFWKFATILRKICIHVEKNHFIGEIISRLSAVLTESRQEEELQRGESSLASQKTHVLSLSGLTKLGKGSRPISAQLLVNLFQYFQDLSHKMYVLKPPWPHTNRWYLCLKRSFQYHIEYV